MRDRAADASPPTRHTAATHTHTHTIVLTLSHTHSHSGPTHTYTVTHSGSIRTKRPDHASTTCQTDLF